MSELKEVLGVTVRRADREIDTQLRVFEGNARVHIEFAHTSDGASLTVEQARHFAKQIRRIAARVETAARVRKSA